MLLTKTMPFFVGLPLLSVFLCAAPVAGGTLQELSCWLEKTGGEMIGKAARKMHDGRIVYAPQVGDWYKAAWLRDYVMMLEGGLVPKERQNAVAELFLSAVTPEGEGFDCIKFDGTVVRRPGYDTVGDKSVMDGYTYITTLIYETWRQTRDGKWLRPEILDKLAQMLDAMPHDGKNGLPWIDPAKKRERCPWGFTDSVGKTGNLFFMSLLEIRARRELASMLREARRPDEADAQMLRARTLSDAANRVFWDDSEGLYRAATVRCRQHDVWGSAYAIWLGVVPDDRADRIARYFKDNYGGLVQNGQIRHMPSGQYWDETCWNKKDHYQNGWFWGTATGWFCWALERVDPALVDQTYNDLISDYRRRGVNERTFGTKTACPDYLANVALPLQGLRRLIEKRHQPGAAGAVGRFR